MRDTIGLLVCVFIYTVTFFWFGMWCQAKVDQWQIKKFEDAAFSDGCGKCAQFERMKCDRDNNLQGQEGFTQIP